MKPNFQDMAVCDSPCAVVWPSSIQGDYLSRVYPYLHINRCDISSVQSRHPKPSPAAALAAGMANPHAVYLAYSTLVTRNEVIACRWPCRKPVRKGAQSHGDDEPFA